MNLLELLHLRNTFENFWGAEKLLGENLNKGLVKGGECFSKNSSKQCTN